MTFVAIGKGVRQPDLNSCQFRSFLSFGSLCSLLGQNLLPFAALNHCLQLFLAPFLRELLPFLLFCFCGFGFGAFQLLTTSALDFGEFKSC